MKVERRIQQLENCKTLIQFTNCLYNPKFDQYFPSNVKNRKYLRIWISCLIDSLDTKHLDHSTLEELSQYVFPTLLDDDTKTFSKMRKCFVKWVENYVDKK